MCANLRTIDHVHEERDLLRLSLESSLVTNLKEIAWVVEKEFIRWLVNNSGSRPDWVSVGIGDDAAVLRWQDDLVVTNDSIADGTHFDLKYHSLQRVGRKALAVSLSDMAAMGCRPLVLGPRILRTETAAVLGLGLLLDAGARAL